MQLRPHGSGGLTAMVLLPESLLAQPAALAGASGGGPREEQPYVGPHAAPPMPEFGAGPYQMGPAHPSYPSNPDGPRLARAALATEQRWRRREQHGSGWPADTRGPGAGIGPGIGPNIGPNTGGFDSADVWMPPRGPAGTATSCPGGPQPAAPELGPG